MLQLTGMIFRQAKNLFTCLALFPVLAVVFALSMTSSATTSKSTGYMSW